MVWDTLIRKFDALLRRCYRIEEFSQDEGCVLRISLARSDRSIDLADGTRIQRGEPIGELHLWNEHIPQMPRTGPDLAWARTSWRAITRSLRQLAAYIETDPRFQDIQAFRGESSFRDWADLAQAAAIMEKLGFEYVELSPTCLWERLAQWGDHFYVLALTLAFNPASLKGKKLWKMKRGQFWISRQTLRNKYGAKRVSCS